MFSAKDSDKPTAKPIRRESLQKAGDDCGIFECQLDKDQNRANVELCLIK